MRYYIASHKTEFYLQDTTNIYNFKEDDEKIKEEAKVLMKLKII